MSILIAAGGTGGHIYPALAIAEEFRLQRPDLPIYFVGTPHGLENKIVPPKGFLLHHIRVGKLNQVSKLEKILTLLKMPFALYESWRLIRKTRPRVVLGVGGYASGPILLMASMCGIRTAIWEPNAMPGMTNRMLSRFVDECFLVFDSAKAFLKAKRYINSGMPVRSEIEKASVKPVSAEARHLLVFGGSQGARAVNTAVAGIANGEFLRQHEVVHQTGPVDFVRTKQAYGKALPSEKIEVTEYLSNMHERYEWADMIVARAGASTVAELAACGKIAVLIPLPTAADNHQQKNAEALVQKDAAVMILQKDLTPESLRKSLLDLEASPERRQKMQQNIQKFHKPKAAAQIVSHLLSRMQ